jgi:hypothetical protein
VYGIQNINIKINSEYNFITQTGPMKNIISYLRKPNLLQRLWKRALSFFFIEQWTLLIASDANYKTLSWKIFKPFIPPLDRFWADPFLWKQGDDYFIFYEELPYSTSRGHISCITLDKKMNPVTNQIVLKRPYHLSYPFIFEYDGQVYMLPETKENKAIELYRCTQFPDQWEFVKTLIPGITAVDATLLEANGKWWMFVNVVESGGNAWDSLHLFYAENPLSENWTPHPLNPVVKDIHYARPAGRIFVDGGNFIRPSQDCSARYGYALNFNRISTLTETDYKETPEHKFTPPVNSKKILSVHTWNQAGALSLIDAEFRRQRY